MRLTIFLLVMTLGVAVTPARADDSQTEVSISKAIVDGFAVNGPTSIQLDQLEKDAFSHSYSHDTNEQRICRLEHFVFGKQSTGDLSKRYNKLRTALSPRAADQPTTQDGKTPGTSASNTSTPGTSASRTGADPASTASISAAPPKVYEFPTFFPKREEAPPPAETPRKHMGLIDIMNRGIDSYNAHKYSNAEDDFEECCAMAPGMSRCFAYLAITKMQLNLRQAAIDAFRTSFMLDPFGTYGRYAKSCLIVLAGDEAMRKRPPVDSKEILDIAMKNIDKQSADISGRHQTQASQIAGSRIGYRQDYSMIDSRIQSNNARIEGTLRAAHTVESANNLKHMLAVKKMPGDANLRAWGTTLTTRYYGNETYLNAPYYIPKERPMELKAIVQSLQSVHNKPKPAPRRDHNVKSSPGKHSSAPKSGHARKHQ
ncbi:MAG: hypothetical protein EKK48_08610 [Candidatus Melainabacteria bacterium]|nr:MAG: hypothetical protein EKK48_08610 [Candidatus Melainabacteria bacterium]